MVALPPDTSQTRLLRKRRVQELVYKEFIYFALDHGGEMGRTRWLTNLTTFLTLRLVRTTGRASASASARQRASSLPKPAP